MGIGSNGGMPSTSLLPLPCSARRISPAAPSSARGPAGGALSRAAALALALGWATGLALCAVGVRAERLEGRVERVTDGDSLWVRVSEPQGAFGDGPVLKVRMAGIDAPERCQLHGAEAGAALRERLLGQAVRLDRSGLDAYDRSLARVSLAGEDIGAWMVASGHAWSYSRKSSAEQPGGRYAREQRAARAAGRGLFGQADPVPPWVFRRLNGPCSPGPGTAGDR